MRNEWETLDHICDWETKLMAQNVMPQGDPSEDEVLRQVNVMPLDLPPPETKRWVPRRKAVIVNACRAGRRKGVNLAFGNSGRDERRKRCAVWCSLADARSR
jgi:hypothetical protein